MWADFNLKMALDLVFEESSADKALDRLNRMALEATRSRNSMIAIMNDELGWLEVAHGAGEEWSRRLEGERLKVDVGATEGIVSYVAATGSGFMTGNVKEEPRYRNLFNTTMSEIAVPVKDKFGRIRAVLNVESDVKDAYQDDAYQFLSGLAIVSAMVLERADLQADAEALIRIGNALDSAMTEEDLVSGVLDVASEVLRFQAFSIFLYDPARELFVLRGSVGQLRDQVGLIGYRRGEGCTGWVCETGQPILIKTHPQQDPRWRARHVEFPGDEVASFLCVPVVYRGRSIGALRAVRRATDNPFLDNQFTENDQVVLTAIAEQMASGLENMRSVEKLLRSERMIAWGELSAKSSHMIGNRVFALKGDVNELYHLLDSSEPNLAELKELQKSLSTNVERVEEILQDFRDFVTATQLERLPSDVGQLLQETLAEVFPRRTKVKLEVQIAKDLPLVLLDAKKMRRAFSELVENSFNYMEEGALCVCANAADEADIRKGLAARGKKYVKIEIEDTGPGVGTDKKTVIFQPFFSGRVKGMGLGLSIVKGIVDAHEGVIYEAGEEGKGAKFVILLPVAERS